MRFLCLVLCAGCGADLGGRQEELISPVNVIASGQQMPCAVAVDSSFVYFANCTESGAIRRVGKFGGVVTTLADGLAAPQAIAVDDFNVYWVEAGNAAGEYTNGGIYAVSKWGGPKTRLAADTGQPRTLAMDSGSIYWGGADAIHSVSKLGGAVHNLAAASGVTSLAVDATTIYWGEDHYIVGYIIAAPRLGGPRTQLANALPVSLQADFAQLYWIDGGGDVFSMSKLGGSIRTLYTSPGCCGAALAIDGTYAFWTTNDSLQRIPKIGGLRAQLASGLNQPRGLAVDNYSVYFAVYGGGTIDAVSKLLSF